MHKKIPHALTIAGSDSGAGAGIQADLKTFAALGVYGTTAITALTAQNSMEVANVCAIPPEFVAEQIQTVTQDMKPDAIKIGMIVDEHIIRHVAQALKPLINDNIKIILDPVMVAKSGDRLLNHNAIDALKTELIPHAFLITPNIPEAAELLNQNEQDITRYIQGKTNAYDAMTHIARQLIEIGAQNVFLKGGHIPAEICNDILHDGEKSRIFSKPYIKTKNTHGTGCTISAAITAQIAKGKTLKKAVKKAHRYTHKAIKNADILNIGHGHGPLNHFHWR